MCARVLKILSWWRLFLLPVLLTFHSWASAQSSVSSELRRTLSGTWYAQDAFRENWDGKRFGLNTGREALCVYCCGQTYRVTSRIILDVSPPDSPRVLAGEYHTNYEATDNIKPTSESELDYPAWEIVCGPNPNPSRALGYSKGDAEILQDPADTASLLIRLSPSDYDKDTFPIKVVDGNTFELLILPAHLNNGINATRTFFK